MQSPAYHFIVNLLQANFTFHQYEWPILESLKQSGLTDAGKLALRLVTSVPPDEVKKLVAELRKADSKQFDQVSEAAKAFVLPTPASLSLESSICLFLLTNYFMECLKTGGYLKSDQVDLSGDLVFLITRAILVIFKLKTSFSPSNSQTVRLIPQQMTLQGFFPTTLFHSRNSNSRQ